MATNSSQLWTRIVGNSSNTDATSYATASTAPISGQVIVAAVVSLKATTPDTPTASGTNGMSGTWTQIGSTVTLQTPAGNFIGLSLFWSTATSGTAGVVTFNFTNTQLAAVWDLITSPFINITTPNVQTKTATDTGAGTTLSVVLDAALTAAANWVIGAFAVQSSSAPTLTAASTEYLPAVSPSNAAASDGVGLKVCVGPLITSAMQSFTGSVAKIGFAVEIAQDGTGASTGASVFANAGGLNGGLQ